MQRRHTGHVEPLVVPLKRSNLLAVKVLDGSTDALCTIGVEEEEGRLCCDKVC
jgi:hypothetical protein